MSGELCKRLHRLLDHAVRPALDVLGPRFAGHQAEALLLAIAAQESRALNRRQSGNGPARGFWQFEQGGGVVGLLRHHATEPEMQKLCERFIVPPVSGSIHAAIEYHDVLAAACARLLLWAHPAALPARDAGPDAAWRYYLDQWRPGKPHPATWPGLWEQAWMVVEGGA